LWRGSEIRPKGQNLKGVDCGTGAAQSGSEAVNGDISATQWSVSRFDTEKDVLACEHCNFVMNRKVARAAGPVV